MKLVIAIFLAIMPVATFAVTDGINVTATVNTCNQNGTCQSSIGETVANCPTDCKSIDPGPVGCVTDCEDKTTLQITNVVSVPTDKNAAISWSTNLHALSSISWGLTSNYELGTQALVDAGTSFATVINNLNSDTFYYYKIDAQTVAPPTKTAVHYGTFTTKAQDEPPANPIPFDATYNPQIKAIVLTWENPDESDFTSVRLLRSTSFFPSVPGDETLIYEGAAESFVDSNISTGVTYYYTIFAKDTGGNFSSGSVDSEKVPEDGSDKISPPPVGPIEPPVEDIFDSLPDSAVTPDEVAKLVFFVEQNGKTAEFVENSNIEISGTGNIKIWVDYESLPEVLKTIAVTMGHPREGNKIFSFLLRVNETKTKYEAIIAPPSDTGEYKTAIYILDHKNSKLGKVSGVLNAAGETTILGPIYKVPTEILDIGSAVGVITGVTETIIITTRVRSIYDLYLLLMRFGGAILGAIGLRRKREPWGVVYDAVTKRPLDPAYIVVKKDGKQVADGITDLDGRYGFLLPGDTYTIEAGKTHYQFPSRTLAGQSSDELYANLYHGEKVLTVPGEVITRNIPLDPVGFDWNEFVKGKKELFRIYSRREKIKSMIFGAFYLFGFILTLLSTFISPSVINFITLGLYVAIYVIQSLWRHSSRAVQVRDRESGEPYSFAVVRVFLSHLNQEVKRVVADEFGRFYLLVSPGKYYLTIDAKQADGSYRRVYKSADTDMPKGVLTENIEISNSQSPTSNKSFNSQNPKFGILGLVILLGFGLWSLGFAHSAQAATSSFNKLVNYQGKLTDSAGAIVGDGDYNLTFRIYTASTGGSAAWTESHTSTSTQVTVTNGLFSVLLGGITSLSSFDFNRDLYLGVSVGASSSVPVWDAEMTPRKRLGSVPSAFVADTLDGLDSESFLRSDDPDTMASSSTTTLLTLNQSGTGGILSVQKSGTAMLTVINSGNVGIGTTSPYARLSVVGETVASHFTATTTATSTFGGAISVTESATSSFAWGIDLSDGCFSIDGTCVGAGPSGTGAANRATFWTGASTLSYDDDFAWDNTNKRLGLGTSSPYTRLSVAGQIVSNNFSATSSTATSSILGALGIGTTTPTERFQLVGGNFLQKPLSSISALNNQAMTFGVLGQIRLSGNRLFLVDADDFLVYNISNPNNITLVSSTTLDTGSDINVFDVAGSYAYVGHNDGLLEVIDVSGAPLPSVVGTTTITTAYTEILAQGSYVYAITSSALYVIDVSNPRSPRQVSSLTLAGGNSAQGGAIAGRYIYLAQQLTTHFRIIDISDPRDPRSVSTTDLGARAADVAVSGNLAYVSGDDTVYIKVLNIANPGSPTVLATLSTGLTSPTELHIMGSYLVIHDSTVSKIIDVSSSTNPVIWSTLTNHNGAASSRTLAVSGRYIYQASRPNAFVAVYDMSNLETHAATIHQLEAGQLTVRNGLSILGNISSTGGMNIGAGGLYSAGAGAFSVSASSTNSVDPVLRVSLSDNNSTAVSDVLQLTHMASGTASNNIGTGVLFSAENDSWSATTTGRIASLLTSTSLSSPTSVFTFSLRNSVTGLSEFMRLNSSGNLGLGTTSPYAKLSVVGEVVASHFTATSTTATSSFAGKVGVGTTTPSEQLSVANRLYVGGTGTSTFENNVRVYGLVQIGSNSIYLRDGATSTFNGGIEATYLNLTGSTATSTLTNGINVASGCFSISGTCVGGSNLTGSGAVSRTAFWTAAGNLSYDDDFVWNNTDKRLGLGTTSPYARLSVVGETVARNFTATSTTATSTMSGVLFVGIGTNNAGSIFSVGTTSIPLFDIDKATGKIAVATSSTASNNWKMTIQGGLCITGGTSCPAVQNNGGLSVDSTGVIGDDPGDVFDIAEIYPASEVMEAGEIVGLDAGDQEGKLLVKRGKEGEVIVGVVSTATAISINGANIHIAPEREATSTKPRVALVGRVPVKVNLENGPIKAGDEVAPSSIPGVGRKAKTGEQTVGFALRDWSESDDGRVLIYVRTGFARLDPAISGDTIDYGSKHLKVKSIEGFDGSWRIDENGKLTIKTVEADNVKTKSLCIEDICLGRSELERLLQSGNVSSAVAPAPQVEEHEEVSTTSPQATADETAQVDEPILSEEQVTDAEPEITATEPAEEPLETIEPVSEVEVEQPPIEVPLAPAEPTE